MYLCSAFTYIRVTYSYRCICRVLGKGTLAWMNCCWIIVTLPPLFFTYIRFIYSYVWNKYVWGTQASINCCQHSFVFTLSSFIFSCLDQPMKLCARIKFCWINFVQIWLFNLLILIWSLKTNDKSMCSYPICVVVVETRFSQVY